MPTILTVTVGDIATQAVDAVVNAAAPGLGGGTGVSRALHAAAGPELFAAAQALDPPPGRGQAAATPGFGLPAKWVIHTVGPIWIGGGIGEEATLASCYRRALDVARELGARTIAFPAIATGAYRFPKEKAAAIAVATVMEAIDAVPGAFDEIVFCHRTEENAAFIRAALGATG